MRSVEFIVEQVGGYVAMKVDPRSKEQIYDVMSNYVGTDQLINDLHLTLMYDESEPTFSVTPSRASYVAKIKDIDMLGEEDSPWRAVVFKLESPELHQRFSELEKLGYTNSHDSYIPHVSIIYGPSKDQIEKIIDNKIDIIDNIKTINLHNEYVQKLEKPDPDTA